MLPQESRHWCKGEHRSFAEYDTLHVIPRDANQLFASLQRLWLTIFGVLRPLIFGYGIENMCTVIRKAKLKAQLTAGLKHGAEYLCALSLENKIRHCIKYGLEEYGKPQYRKNFGMLKWLKSFLGTISSYARNFAGTPPGLLSAVGPKD
jgi:hypothetical protein